MSWPLKRLIILLIYRFVFSWLLGISSTIHLCLIFLLFILFCWTFVLSCIFISPFCATLHQRSKGIFCFMSHHLWDLLISIWSGSSNLFYLILIDYMIHNWFLTFILLSAFLKIQCSIGFWSVDWYLLVFFLCLYSTWHNDWLLTHDIR